MMKLLQADAMMIGVAAEKAIVLLTIFFLFTGCVKMGGVKMNGKKALVVIAPTGFQDHEFAMTCRGLEEKGIEIEIASTKEGVCTGKFGTTVNAKSIDDYDFNEFDAIVFVGGPGVPLVRTDDRMIKAAKTFYENGKVVAAICWAPTILAKAGVLKGKNATVWVGYDPEYAKSTVDVLRDYGANPDLRPVVVDGRIVTGNGPSAAESFGKTLAEVIMNN